MNSFIASIIQIDLGLGIKFASSNVVNALIFFEDIKQNDCNYRI